MKKITTFLLTLALFASLTGVVSANPGDGPIFNPETINNPAPLSNPGDGPIFGGE